MSTKIKVAVIDDHPLVRQGLIENFEDDDGFEVVGEGGSADEAVAVACGRAPDIIFLDINMPGGGVEAARTIQQRMPGILIAMFSFRQDLAIVRDAFAAGARGYIVKGVSGPGFITAAHQIIAGEIYVDPSVADRLAAAGSDPAAAEIVKPRYATEG
jgi:two-component system, NarL family, nitrate/nitrite response regulator NarL